MRERQYFRHPSSNLLFDDLVFETDLSSALQQDGLILDAVAEGGLCRCVGAREQNL